jgi:hypothetical protein
MCLGGPLTNLSRVSVARRLSNVIGAYPEHETDHRTALDSTALVGSRVSPWPECAIRFRQLTLEGLMGRRNTVALAI